VARLTLRRRWEPAPGDAAQPRHQHQPCHPLAGNRGALGLQFCVHAWRAVGAMRGGMEGVNRTGFAGGSNR
jgi:hypothetical protein